MRTLLLGLVVCWPVLAAEPEKPLVLEKDELAVLADAKSPDYQKLMERYEGKLVKLYGKVQYVVPVGGRSSYHVDVAPQKAGHRVLRLEWSLDPATQRAKDQIHKRDADPVTAKKATASTIYGRLVKGVLTDASFDPKVAGTGAKGDAKEPARLK